VHQRLLWLLIVALLIAIFAVIAQRNEGMVGPLSLKDFSSLVYKVALLLFVFAAVLAVFHGRSKQALTAALLWGVVGLLLIAGYSYKFELREAGDRVLAQLVPGHVISHGRTVEVARTSGGDFAISAQINGVRVPMILDTGASSVVLSRDDAKAIGLPLEVLAYTVTIETANGRTRAAPVTIDRIAIGSLLERSVEALVAQPGQLRTSLLGMSFLNRLRSWEVSGDRLLLRGYP
jgi:aspartyl protease family protein